MRRPSRAQAAGGEEPRASQMTMDEAAMKERYGRDIPTKTCGDRTQKWCSNTFTPEFARTLFPPVTWLPSYSQDACAKIRGDIVAGITVAIVVIPQGLSYAALALLNPVVGFYTTIFPSFIYMLFGTSRECHIGPFALVSLLTADGVLAVLPASEDVADMNAEITVFNHTFANYEDAALNTASALALLVGVFQIAFSMLGLGQIVMSVISDPFVSGFTTGSAFLIGASQLSGLFGVPGYRDNNIFVVVIEVVKQIIDGQANWAAFTIGICCLVALFCFRHINKTVLAGKIPVPGELIVVVCAGLVSEYGASHIGAGNQTLYEVYGYSIVGSVEPSIPAPRVPYMTTAMLGVLVGPAIVICIVGYMVSIAVSKLFADKNDYEISGSQELLALGLANGFGGFFNCYPAAASLSRTAIVDAAGGRTQLHNVFSIILLVIVLYALAFLLAPLPKATLSAVVYIALIGLFLGFRQLVDAFALRWQDGCIWLVTFLATTLGGVTVGIAVGIGFSLLLLLQRISRPYNAILGRVPGTVAFRSVKRFETLQMHNVKIFRFDASLGFVNRNFFEECVLKVADGRHSHSRFDDFSKPKIIIIQCSSINSIDASALKTISKLVARLKKRGIDLLLCSAKWDVRTLLQRAAKSRYEQSRKAAKQCCAPSPKKDEAVSGEEEEQEQKNGDIEMAVVGAPESQHAGATVPSNESEADALDRAPEGAEGQRQEKPKDVEKEDRRHSSFEVVNHENIFPTLSHALAWIHAKHGFIFESELTSPEVDFYFAGAASDGGVVESYDDSDHTQTGEQQQQQWPDLAESSADANVPVGGDATSRSNSESSSEVQSAATVPIPGPDDEGDDASHTSLTREQELGTDCTATISNEDDGASAKSKEE